jgi:hypothetical protein
MRSGFIRDGIGSIEDDKGKQDKSTGKSLNAITLQSPPYPRASQRRKRYNELIGFHHKEKPMRRMFGFLIGIFVGWLVGSTIALLLAPESGEKLRGQLRARSTNFMGEIKFAADTRRTQLEDQLAVLRAPHYPAK